MVNIENGGGLAPPLPRVAPVYYIKLQLPVWTIFLIEACVGRTKTWVVSFASESTHLLEEKILDFRFSLSFLSYRA